MMYDVYNTHMFTSHHSVFMYTCTCILLSMLNVHYFLLFEALMEDRLFK